MSKRKRNLFGHDEPKAVPTKRLSDKSELLWQGVKSAQVAAAEAVNRAIETLNEVTARHMATLDGVDVEDWNFHVPTGQWVKKVKGGE